MPRLPESPVDTPRARGAATASAAGPSRRVLLQALLTWWALSTLGSVAAAAPLLPWFDVLGNTPFASVSDDLALLHERLFSATTTAHLLPLAAVLQGTLQQLLLWRLVLVVPAAITACACVSPQRSLGSATTKAAWLLPRFFGLTLTLQLLTLTLTGLGLGHAGSWLGRAEPSAIELGVGVTVGAFTLVLATCCLTLLELSRLALFQRPTRLSRRRSAWSSLLDGLDVLRRRPVATVGVIGGYFALGIGLCLTCNVAGTALAAWVPEGPAQGASWLLAQLGVGMALGCRVLGWRAARRWFTQP